MNVPGFTIRIEGLPHGKQRARHGNGRTFTPRETVLAEGEIRRIWEQEGCPRLPDGPVHLEVELGVVRPESHYTRRRMLSKEGQRNWRPFRRKPDVDNALKLVMDALNTRAWHDDVRVVEAHVLRVWTDRPYTLINARTIA